MATTLTLPKLDVVTAKEQAEELYAAYKNGLTVNLQLASDCLCFLLGHAETPAAERSKYVEQFIELKQAKQTTRQKEFDAAKREEAKQQEKKLVAERVSVYRSSSHFFALMKAIKEVYDSFGNTNNAFFKGGKPGFVKELLVYGERLRVGACEVFEKTLDGLIKYVSDNLKRLPFLTKVLEAAQNLLNKEVRPLPNLDKRGTVSPLI